MNNELCKKDRVSSDFLITKRALVTQHRFANLDVLMNSHKQNGCCFRCLKTETNSKCLSENHYFLGDKET